MFHDDYYLKDQIIENCKRIGFYPKTVANISQISFIANMIQQGIGISIVPESLVRLMGDNVTSIQLENVRTLMAFRYHMEKRCLFKLCNTPVDRLYFNTPTS